LTNNGYEISHVLCTLWRQLPAGYLPALHGSEGIELVMPGPDQLRQWALTVAAGFLETDSAIDNSAVAAQQVDRLAAGANPNCRPYLALIAREPAGGAMLQINAGAALVRSASTRFARRRNGVQQALIAERLRAASEAGCDVAFSIANKGDGSERNLRRFGFEFLQEGCIMSKA
jgi:hypothetical protein